MADSTNGRSLAAVVLAAGQGKRMGASVPKVLVETCGWSMVEHVLDALDPLGAHPTVVVYGHGGEAVRSALAGRDLQFAEQPEQRGTGHAVQCALPALGGAGGDVLVVCGDTPLLSHDVLRELVEDHRRADRGLTVLSAELEDPGSLGRIVRNDAGDLVAIREAADATDAERAIREINTGVIIASRALLEGALARLSPDNAQGELYLTDVPEILLEDLASESGADPAGRAVGAKSVADPLSALGVNRPSELLQATRALRARILARLADSGVRIEDPATTVVDAGVEVGAGTLLRPFTFLVAGARVGEGCTVGPHSTVGPGSTLGEGVRIGAHVEIRGATIEPGARILGPSRLVGVVVGAGAWIGPGVVTEGSAEGRIVIGERARIGAGAVLVAPLTVGADAHVAEGEVVTKDVGAAAMTETDTHE
ncbi:MAG: bifunctional UDP-N-acetylglucosamine diphosphorylase/glucosamine-1-phosphate N-acetyltransferase GlmU [Planctomycetota bacterium]|jgi:bifunctional UDP-N-acetylglucosamine pyrophosphorylase/glucosamine-1-phosphate N-acetyltransferase